MNIIIRKGKAVKSSNDLTAIPLGVEYEELSRNLNDKDNVVKNDDREDLRKNKKFSLDMIPNEKSNTTFLLIPGSQLVNYENSQSDSLPYPQSNNEVPFSSSNVWIGR
jgi:hypothetical protein